MSADKIHPCRALDALVAEKVMGWKYMNPFLNERGWLHAHAGQWETGEEEDGAAIYRDLPVWSSDPGEALYLLQQHNREARKAHLKPELSLICNGGLWKIGHLNEMGNSGAFWDFHNWQETPALAIVVGVLLQYVSLEDIERACAGEGACRA